MQKTIQNTIQEIQEFLQDTKLLVVSKKQGRESVEACITSGAKLFGENKVQEIIEKDWERIKKHHPDISLHFIGHLQTNKVKALCPLVDVIQSIDSIKLAKKVNEVCKAYGKVMPVFLQLNLTNEEQKFGFAEDKIHEAYKEIANLSHIELKGIMCMAKHGASEAELRSTFQKAKHIQTSLNLEELSMGMSEDYKIAKEEGSTMVRIGSKIFNSI